MNGPNIGKLIQIRKSMTRLGHAGTGIVVISKRKEGYFVTVLENVGKMTVNDIPLTERAVRLNPNDVLNINDTSLQFFLGPSHKQSTVSVF